MPDAENTQGIESSAATSEFETATAREWEFNACPTEGCLCRGVDGLEIGDWFRLDRSGCGPESGDMAYEGWVGDLSFQVTLRPNGKLTVLWWVDRDGS